jgi:hypothetical protein
MFICFFLHNWFYCSKCMADLKIIRVIRVVNCATGMNGKDGLQEQVEILDELSKKLDQYFAMRDFGINAGSDR